MRRAIALIGIVATASWALLSSHNAWAFPEFSGKTGVSCVTCHTNPAGGAALTDAGKAFKSDGTKPKASEAAAAEYIGSGKCKLCHSAQFKSWEETPHAKSMDALKGEKTDAQVAMAKALKVELTAAADKTDECVSCHVTGFKLAGGFPQEDEAVNATLAHVGCENCHGPGSLHLKAKMAEKKNFINGAVTANMCQNCHTAETSPKFDFETFSKTGLHVMKAKKKSEKEGD